jgi:two-component system chemotaxis response regulator CheB
MTGPPPHVIRLVVADDSPAVRDILRAMVEADGGIRIVGEAGTGREAVEMAHTHRPDVILMDVRMPEMNGIEATARIMASRATPIIVFSSHTRTAEARESIDILAAGALDVMAKPDLASDEALRECSLELRKKIRNASGVAVVRHIRPSFQGSGEGFLPERENGRRFRVVGIGASTGGPGALRDLFSNLPASFGMPVLVVQHITAGFTGGFSEWLQQYTPLPVRIAKASDKAEPGTILLAPEGRQMELFPDGAVRAVSRVSDSVHLPSADALLSSVALSFAEDAVGVLLTGMGSDGAEGLLKIRKAGGRTYAQDEASCIVFGMPAEAIRRGAAALVLDPASIAESLRALPVGRRRSDGRHA